MATHLAHEVNVEQVFSRAGLLSDPNINPDYLARLVMVSVNKKAFRPSVKAIKDKYYEIFRGPGKSGAGSSSDTDGQREFDGEEQLDNLRAHPQWAVYCDRARAYDQRHVRGAQLISSRINLELDECKLS